MVWIKPKPGGGGPVDEERKQWRTLIRNPYFKLQQQRDDQPMPAWVEKKRKSFEGDRNRRSKVHKTSSPNTGEARTESGKSFYRILLLRKSPSSTDEDTEENVVSPYFVVSEERRENKIQQEWQFIKADVLPKVQQIAKEVGAFKEGKLDLAHPELERLDTFLLLQFEMLYMNESNEKEVKAARQKRLKALPKACEQAEELLLASQCTIRDSREAVNKGKLLVYPSKIRFEAASGGQRLTIPFTEISAVTKEATSFLKKDAIKMSLTTDQSRKQEYFFGGIAKRDELYDMLAHLWNVSIDERFQRVRDSPRGHSAPAIIVSDKSEQIAIPGQSNNNGRRAEGSPPPGSPSPSSNSASPRKNSWGEAAGLTPTRLSQPSLQPGSTEVLETNKRNANYRNMFRLPSEEHLIYEIDCMLKSRTHNAWLQGTIYTSENFVCFYGIEEVPVPVGERAWRLLSGYETVTVENTFSLVIPFNEIDEINNLTNKSPIVMNVHTRHNVYDFMLDSKSAFKKLVHQWKEFWANMSNIEIKSDGDVDSLEPTLEFRWHWKGKAFDWGDKSHWRSFYGEDFSISLLEEEEEKSRLWKEYFARNNVRVAIDMLKTTEFEELVTSVGVPNYLRPKIWQICSGSIYNILVCSNADKLTKNEKEKQRNERNKQRQQQEGEGDEVKEERRLRAEKRRRRGSRRKRRDVSYYKLFKIFRNKETLVTKEIEKDLHRSFFHPFYETKNGAEGRNAAIDSLRNVLTAYAWHNPEIGYCQSMNIICAFLLLLLSEEEAFWMMCMLCEHTLKNYYTNEMLGSIVDQRVFDLLLSETMPHIHKHITETLELPIAWFTLPWFLCLFVGKLPLSCVLHVLDCFFCKGVPVLFQVGLALFKLAENDIMSASVHQDGSNVLQRMQSSFMLVNKSQLFKIAFKDYGHITMDKIKQLRYIYKLEVIKEMETDLVKNVEWQKKWQERRQMREEELKKIQEDHHGNVKEPEKEKENDADSLMLVDLGMEDEDEEEDEEDTPTNEQSENPLLPQYMMESGTLTTAKQRQAFLKMRAAVKRSRMRSRRGMSALKFTDYKAMKNSGQYVLNTAGSREGSPMLSTAKDTHNTSNNTSNNTHNTGNNNGNKKMKRRSSTFTQLPPAATSTSASPRVPLIDWGDVREEGGDGDDGEERERSNSLTPRHSDCLQHSSSVDAVTTYNSNSIL